VYLADIERRVAAATILWAPNIEQSYRHPAIDRFIQATRRRLEEECRAAGYRKPEKSDLSRMRDSGAYPGEPRIETQLRNGGYAAAALARRIGRAIRDRPHNRRGR
jgi:hypothetical protein